MTEQRDPQVHPEQSDQPILDRSGMEVLSPEECYRLLEGTPIGRAAFLVDGEPVILPVNYKVVDGTIVFRSVEGQKLYAAAAEQPMAFEIDSWDALTRRGWSVLVKGTASEVTQWAEVEVLEQQGLVPWSDEVWRNKWIRVTPTEMSGRAIR